MILENQDILLIEHMDFPDFKDKNLDGMFGISKIFSPLHHKSPFTSVIQNTLKTMAKDNIEAKIVLILRLGGGYPYMKIYFMEDYDYFHIRDDVTGRKETIYWIKLFDQGKLMLALKHIKKKYYKDNHLVKEEYALKDCKDTGCRAMIDTKSYFIYGPKSQIGELTSIKASNCNDLSDLPELEFSFFDVNPANSISSSSIELILRPEEYMLNNHSYEEGSCRVGITDHHTDYGWNFGIMFLKKFMVIYDFKDSFIGFVRAKNSNEENQIDD